MSSRSEIEAAVATALSASGRSFAEAHGSTTLGAVLTEWTALVVDWNRRIDLTAARSLGELVDLLVADALELAATIDGGSDASVVDVGTGAGAPGLGLALLRPSLRVTLVEPKVKRVAFLRSVLGSVGRADVRVERKRADELTDETFDIAVSRATLEPQAWLAEGARLARRRVWVLLAQGDAPSHPSLRLAEDRRYAWPLTRAQRRALAFEPIPPG